MSHDDQNSLSGGKSTSLFGLPLSWGTQFIISVLGSTLSWWFQDKWTEGRIIPGARSLGELLWQLAPFIVSSFLMLFFLMWVAALLIQLSVWSTPRSSPNAANLSSRRSTRAEFARRLLAFLGFTIVVAAFYGCTLSAANRFVPSEAGPVSAIAGILALVVTFIFVPRIVRGQPAKQVETLRVTQIDSVTRPNGPPIWWIKTAAWIPTILFLVVFFFPLQSVRIEWRLASLAFALLWPFALNRVRLWTFKIGHEGNPARAIRLNRFLAWVPGYPGSLEGMILFDSGRYGEAREFLKPLAFDGKGRPRLTSLELYTYALALVNDGNASEAEPLLEAAIHVSQRPDVMEVALASCLLTQGKDAGRACELIEKALAAPQLRTSNYGKAADHANRIARYAWALASSGRHDEAVEQISAALAEFSKLSKVEIASVQYFVGEAWHALGDLKKARSAFQDASDLAPSSIAALSSQKALAKLSQA